MFEPVRGGTRGGQAEFKWSDVSADKDRENYLGHSINAPTGRWQKNKDVHWYSRDKQQTEEARLAEIRAIKEAEAEAMAAVLGFAPKAGTSAAAPGGTASGANAIAVAPKAPVGEVLIPEKEEKKRRKAERKEEKRLKSERKERRRAERDTNGEGDNSIGERRHARDRSHSPRRDQSHDARNLRRPRSPPVRTGRSPYGDYERLERERDRGRWDDDAIREQPGAARWGRNR